MACQNFFYMCKDDIPKLIRQYLMGCTLRSWKQRPSCALQLHKEFANLCLRVYGKPKFIHLEIQ